MNNEQWLINMTTDEKAEFLSNLMMHCYYCPCACTNKVRGRNKCPKAFKEWLEKDRIDEVKKQ